MACKNTQKAQFTWKRPSLNEASRIDYFFIQKSLETCTTSCDIRPAHFSKTSHLSVSLKLKLNHENRGCGFWKINNSILQEQECKDLISQTIDNCQREAILDGLNQHDKWEKIKIGIREVSKNYPIRKAVRIKDRCKMLENNLSSLHKIQDQSLHTNVYVNNDILRTENELNTIYIYKAKGAQIRARAEWIEKGEKNTKFFLALEKNRQIKKNIQKIKTENGQTTLKYFKSK